MYISQSVYYLHKTAKAHPKKPLKIQDGIHCLRGLAVQMSLFTVVQQSERKAAWSKSASRRATTANQLIPIPPILCNLHFILVQVRE